MEKVGEWIKSDKWNLQKNTFFPFQQLENLVKSSKI